jgi:TonB family protein
MEAFFLENDGELLRKMHALLKDHQSLDPVTEEPKNTVLRNRVATTLTPWTFCIVGDEAGPSKRVSVNFALGDGPSKSLGQEGVAGGVKGGVAGGVKGGVAGGVNGGVEGGATADQETTWMDLPGGERAVRVGGPVKPPQNTLDVKPVYPQDAQDARVEGIVILEAKIGPDGKVADAKIVRSVPLLDQAALDAVKQWEFVPTVVEGKAVAVVMTITVNFTLQ